MEDIIQLLHEGGYSCVIANGEVRTFTKRGVADIYELLCQDATFLCGASVADKVIGKAAAALMILGGVKEVFTDVISEPALALFRQAQVDIKYTIEVPHIINRTQTGWCPLETLCLPAVSAQECLPLIEGFIQKMNKK